MENRFSPICFPDIRFCADSVINNNLILINFVIFIQLSINNNIRRYQIIISQSGSQLCIFFCQGLKICKMLILGKVTCLELIIISQLYNLPTSRT